MIKAVCFDLDGVFFPKECFQNFKKAIGGDLPEDFVNQILYKSDQIADFKTGNERK